MRRCSAAVLCALAVVVLAGAAVPVASADDRRVESCAAEPPADFADPEGNTSEVIGWVDGYWYNETVEVEADEPLTEEQLDAVTARAAARVEAVRCLAFEERPPIRLQERAAFREAQTGVADNASEAYRRFENARFRTLLLVGTEADALDVRRETLGSASRGYYDPATGEVVLVVEDADAPRVDEVTLAHEYVHALQDQRFGLDRFNATLADRGDGQEGLIEGDAAFVEHRYGEACGANWTCTEAPPETDEDEDEEETNASVGIELALFQPYNDGAAFVRAAYEEGGWEAVNGYYESPPRTTHHTVYPDSYPEFEPRPVPIRNHTNATNGTWTQVDPANRRDYGRIGPGRIAAAMMAPTFEAPRDEDRLYNELQLYNLRGTTRDDLAPFDYDVDAVRGWEGDRLTVYENERNQTTAVWRLAWADEDAAATFRDRYAQLLLYRGATPSQTREGTFRFDDADGYSGIVFIGVEEDEVVVVHAPERNAIVSHYRPKFQYAFNQSWNPDEVVRNQSAPPAPPASAPPEDDELAGGRIGVAVLALLAATVALRRRR